MEPFTCLSLATSAIQIINVSYKIVHRGHHIYKNGSVAKFDHSEAVAGDLRELTQTLASNLESVCQGRQLTEAESKLQSIAVESGEVANELIQHLQSVSRHGGKMNSWKALRHTLATVLGENKISEIGDRLDSLRNELVLRVLVTLKTDSDFNLALSDRRFHDLQEESKKIAEALLDNKNFFTTGINQLLQRHIDDSTAARVRHEETIAAIATLQGHTMSSTISDDLEQGSLLTLENIQQNILNFLWFRFMGDRMADISESYNQTFHWVFAKQNISNQHSLSQWLENGQGCFWISGKAGSGKSTFVKFVTGADGTKELLAAWAGQHSLLCSSFYFWNAGTALQKSQEGLLRKILHESLSQFPELIPVVFPTLCRQFARRQLALHDPSLFELNDAFHRLITQTVMPLRICYFIDGIDEYHGDHIELINKLRSITSPHVKILLSSRPTIACSTAFDNCAMLRLQDFTADDMLVYVRGNLLDDNRMRCLTKANEEAINYLCDEIVAKASGVFLWVMLVVRALQNGLRNHDTIQDLRGRVDELPADLYDFYQSIFNQMDSFYKIQASMLLQIMYEDSQTPKLAPMSLLRLSYAFDDNPEASIDSEVAEISLVEQDLRCHKMEDIIRSRCCGLLEVRSTNTIEATIELSASPPLRHRGFKRIKMDPELKSESPFNREVGFLHKSVLDFLDQPRIRKEMQDATTTKGFDPIVSLVCATLRQIKSAPKELNRNIDESHIWRLLIQALSECSRFSDPPEMDQKLLIEALDDVMDQHWRLIDGWIPRFGNSPNERSHWACSVPTLDSIVGWSPGNIPYDSMFSLACRFGLVGYVKEIISSPPFPDGQSCISLAQKCLNRIILDIDASETNPDLWARQLEIFSFALKNNADPNIPFYSPRLFVPQSPWEVAIERCNPRNLSHCQDWATILQQLVEAGANITGGYWGYVTLQQVTTTNEQEVDIRLMQSPLLAIRDKFLVAIANSNTRTSERKIHLLVRSIENLIIKYGGSYESWIEIQDKHGNQPRSWQRLKDLKLEKQLITQFQELKF